MTRWTFTGFEDDGAAEFIDEATGEAFYERRSRTRSRQRSRRRDLLAAALLQLEGGQPGDPLGALLDLIRKQHTGGSHG